MAIDNIQELEQTLGIESGKLSEMIASDESHTIDLSNKIILDKLTYDERVENIKKESSRAALEVAVKKKREELGLEFTGKTIDNLLDAFKGKVEVDSKVAPEEKYKSLQGDFEKIKGQLIEKESEYDAYKSRIEGEKKNNDIRSKFFDGILGDTLVSKDTIFLEATVKGYSFVDDDGVMVVKDANGSVLKDDKYSPISITDFAKSFGKSYEKQATGGAGGGDSKNNNHKQGTLDAFLKEAETKGWSAYETNAEMGKRIADKTLIV